ncbi:MAG: hypothetical protein JXA20_14640 [Spirochaetes bacterium]|nr:hypothetical protein [Spirochaetota bacterium]
MKRWVILCVITATLSLGCSSDDDSDISALGYISPGDFTAKTLNTTAYSFSSISESCTTITPHCSAVFYYGYVYTFVFAGFAARDAHATPPDFNLKVYWFDVFLPLGTDITRNATISLMKDNHYYSTTTPITVDILDQYDGTYKVTFKNAVTVGAYTIQANDYITGTRY